MKRLITILLCFSLLLCFAGCNKNEPEQTEPAVTTVPTAAATAPTEQTSAAATVPEYQPPLSVVSMPLVKEVTTAEDGTQLCTYTYQNVFPMLQDPEVANSVTLNLLNKIDASRSEAESIAAAAKAAYVPGNSWTPYYCSMYYNPMRIDQGVLSLFGNQISYQGSAHPSYLCVSATYDLVTGKELTFKDILAADYSAADLCQLIVDTMASQADILYPDYATIIRDRFSGEYDYSENWYFSTEGLCLYFSPYDVAPYSAGIVTAQIPYDQLGAYLKDAYFPAERGSYRGSVDIMEFDPKSTEQFKQFAELILDRQGKTGLLYTDGRVFDVRIEIGQMTGASTDAFVPTATVFAAESITAGDAIMLQNSPLKNNTALRLTYNNGSETTEAFLRTKGDDGPFVLIEG